MTGDDIGMRAAIENEILRPETVPEQRRGEPRRPLRTRTINVMFNREGAGWSVTLSGSLFDNDGGGFFGGELENRKRDLIAHTERLRKIWYQEFLALQPGNDGTRNQYSFADTYDLSAYGGSEYWNQALRRLAQAGYELYQAVFLTGDEGLVEAGNRLSGLLRSGPQVISIKADDLLIPWHMLYVPPDGNDMLDPDCPWSFEGFLGYQHFIEHTFKRRPPKFDRIIDAGGGIRTGLNVNKKIDTREGRVTSDRPIKMVVRPLLEFLERLQPGRLSSMTVREKIGDLARAFKSADFNDQVIYFNCHGSVSAAGDQEANIALSDQHRIYTANFRTWLTGRTFEHNPVVFVNACEGGQLASMYLSSFGRVLLEKGANSLLGPQLEIPKDFARQYALEFFRELLRGIPLGDIIRGLARGFAQLHKNPLGIAMSLYRGMDTYFDLPDSSDPASETKRILMVSDDPLERSRATA